MTVSEAFAAMLQSYGVRRVYGLPGEDHMSLLDAFEKIGIRYVPAFNEASAAIMAETDALATGTIGVVIVTLAPGLSNTLNGVADAYLNRAPLLVIAGQFTFARDAVIIRQKLDNFELVQGITKWAARLSQNVHQILAKSIEIAMTHPRGPVFLEVNDEIGQSPATDDPMKWLPAERLNLSEPGVGLPSPATIERLVGELNKAERPALLLGSNQNSMALREAAERFAELYGVPTFTSPAAKGLFRNTNDFFAGCFLNGNFEAKILDRSDLIIAVNLDGFDYFSRPWPYSQRLIAIERVELGQRIFPAALTLVGDAATLLGALPAPAKRKSAWTHKDIVEYREGVRDRLVLREKVGGKR